MRKCSLRRSQWRLHAPAFATVAVLAFVPGPLSHASAYTLKTLHTFCQQGSSCADGVLPQGLIMDSAGAVYGVTSEGGSSGYGTAFKLSVSGHKVTFARLHTFCVKVNCTDGADPQGLLVIDRDGQLYGTAFVGLYGYGVAFELSHASGHWRYTVLYNFCPQQTTCPDGEIPTTGLAYKGQASGQPWDETSPLFGTTSLGGAFGNGVVFELQKSGSSWKETVIHSFKSSSAPNSLLVDSAGNIFGTNQTGGTNGRGLLYRLAAGTWTESTLHNFCDASNCTDGADPGGNIVVDGSGDLFGTTLGGGTGEAACTGSPGTAAPCGVVFERSAGGSYSVLYDFCPASGCTDGAEPDDLVLDATGNLLGSTSQGGAGANGVVFGLTNNSGQWSQAVLHDFCTQAGCTDGYWPLGLLQDSVGDIWGVGQEGGKNNGHGTIFEMQ